MLSAHKKVNRKLKKAVPSDNKRELLPPNKSFYLHRPMVKAILRAYIKNWQYADKISAHELQFDRRFKK